MRANELLRTRVIFVNMNVEYKCEYEMLLNLER